MEYDNLREYLTELDSGFGAQSRKWDQEFNRIWDKSLGSLQQAIRRASRLGGGPHRRQSH